MIEQEMTGLVKTRLARKDFSTGSKGFFGQDKIQVGTDRFQAMVQAVLVGSKADPKAKVQGSVEEAVAAVTDLIQAGMPAKTFASGKTGFRAQGKVSIHGQSFQVQAQAVRLA